MSVETYSLSVDFGGNINTPNFLQEITDSSITTALVGLRIDGDNVNITFASALSGAEQTTLDGLVSAHVAGVQVDIGDVAYNPTGAAPPTTGDDTVDTYENGSIWIDTTNDDAYICTDAGTGAAVWKIVTAGAGGISNFSADSAVTTATTSATYVVMDSMSIQPTVGTYIVHFSASGNTTANGADADYALHLNLVEINHSERHINYNAGNAFNNARTAMHTMAIVTVDGTDIISCRYRVDSGSFQVYGRSIIAFRVA